MDILAAIGLALFLLVALAFAGCSRESSRDAGPSLRRVEMRVTNGLSREDIRGRLGKLAKTAPKEPLSTGAMCYVTAGPPPTSEYVCPACGSKTLYSDELAAEAQWTVPYCRTIILDTAVPFLHLDESEFCRQCRPDVTSPTLTLVIQFNDQFEPRRVRGVTPDDLGLLRSFFAGKATHEGEQGREDPLRDHLHRIEELLGVTRDEPKP